MTRAAIEVRHNAAASRFEATVEGWLCVAAYTRAGNVMRNLVSLGAHTTLVSVIGSDKVGHEVAAMIGKEENVQPGDTYSVVRAEVITDPESGQELGRDEKPVGKIRVEKVMGPHLASCIIESGKDFKAGDVVKRK